MENEKFQDLVLDHLAKITQELTEVKTDVSSLKTDVSILKTDVSGLKADMEQVKGAVVRIENEHGEKLNALFDGHEVMIDRTERLLESENRMEGKLDRLALKTTAHNLELRKAK